MALTKKTTKDEEKKAAKEVVKDKAAPAVKKEKTSLDSAYRVLVKPHVTEKASVVSSENKYIFEVALHANKIEVAKAINEIYGIKPSKVNIVVLEGKAVRRGKITGKRSDIKKAIVTLPKGKTLSIYEGV